MRKLPFVIFCLLFFLAGFNLAAAQAATSSDLKDEFSDPPRQYSSAPLWVWNDMLTEEQVVSTLNDLAGQNVKQVFVHPRPGLMTPYLSDDWFRLWKVALREAERLDMNVWIYDENSYPSGFAGGLVPQAMPESRGLGVQFDEVNQPPKPGDDTLAVFCLNDDDYADVTEKVKAGVPMPQGKYLVASIRRAPTGGWFGGKYYVDLLEPGVTEKFIEITMEAYRRQFGDQFGRRIPGWFTDEPHLRPAGGLHWSRLLPLEFKKRWGYDLISHLPSLIRPLGDYQRVRHNYYQLLLELFIDRWARPCYEYCEKYHLEFTGHYWEHGWPGAGHGGDNMAMYAWHQRPAIDTLMNQYSEDTHAQFGNVRSVMELAGVANQLGKSRTLCEAYGAGGWDLRFEDMKRIGDWLYVLGVNTLDEHLSYITIRGARKRDHPQSFSYHEPWWDAYHILASYFTRLSLVLSHGRQVNNILLIEPTTTAWFYQPDSNQLEKLGGQFQKLVVDLAQAQVEFDLGCENIIAAHGSVEAGLFKVGQCRYDTVVLAPSTENLNAKTMDLIEAFLDAGGTVLCCGSPPALVDGQPSDRGQLASKNPHWQQIEPSAVAADLLKTDRDGFSILRPRDDKGILYHQRRRLDDGDLLFLVNTSIDSPTAVVVKSPARRVQKWDPASGTISSYPFTVSSSGVTIDVQLPPCASLLLFLSPEPSAPVPPERVQSSVIPPLGPIVTRPVDLNVLTLDFVDITAAGETRENTYFYKAAQFAFQKNGLDGNPWDKAVQFRDEIISRKFPTDSGFEATYHFTIEGPVPSPLYIVIERSDLYSITCNSVPVLADKDSWWLDRAFGKIDITAAARPGLNAVTIKASPMTVYHELESAYVLGDFALKPANSGFVIVPAQPISVDSRRTHSTIPDGGMWLSTGIGFDSGAPGDQADDRSPYLIFDLGRAVDLDSLRVWNYNEVNLTHRGVNQLAITASTASQPDSFGVRCGAFTLARAPGTSTNLDFSQTLPVKAKAVRFVRFDILSNHNGVTYPTTDGSRDNAFAGLSEVKFFATGNDGPEQITGITIAGVSSELTHKFNRCARFLVDGSGLAGIGWNQQGYPFYAAGVSYSQSFDVAQPPGRYLVKLSDWYGSVARVMVNDSPAGYIAYQPWQCDVSPWLKTGVNKIDVVVIGTLKNTLGPHHGNPALGAAWPTAFQRAPDTGPPAGTAYSTVGYGLFSPFELVQESP